MIKHEIRVWDPPSSPVWHQSSNHNWMVGGDRLNEVQYAAHVQASPFIVGQYITLGRSPLLQSSGLARVMSIESDHTKVTYRGAPPNHPLIMQLMQIGMEHGNKPWIRWDCVEGWRTLNHEEWHRLVKLNHDKLSDYCKQWEKHCA